MLKQHELIIWLTDNNLRLKKSWGSLIRYWTEPDIWHNIVETIMESKESEGTNKKKLLIYGSIPRGKYNDWIRCYGISNPHNVKIQRFNWLLEEEKQVIITYAKTHD